MLPINQDLSIETREASLKTCQFVATRLQPFDENITSVQCGPNYTVVSNSNDLAYAWGRGMDVSVDAGRLQKLNRYKASDFGVEVTLQNDLRSEMDDCEAESAE